MERGEGSTGTLYSADIALATLALCQLDIRVRRDMARLVDRMVHWMVDMVVVCW